MLDRDECHCSGFQGTDLISRENDILVDKDKCRSIRATVRLSLARVTARDAFGSRHVAGFGE